MYHPRFGTLNDFADGLLADRRRGRVARHLQGCARCRTTVQSLRSLSLEARNLPDLYPSAGFPTTPPMEPASADAVILPLNDPRPQRTPSPAWAAGIAALAIAGLASVFAVSREVQADAEALLCAPEYPAPGTSVRCRYEAVGTARGLDSVVLRGELFGGAHPDYREIRAIASLTRSDRGVFEGEFTLPDWVVNAEMTIESHDGDVVASNLGQFWNLMYGDGSGRPSLDALDARTVTVSQRAPHTALEFGRWITDLYPDSVRAWRRREAMERVARGADWTTELVQARRDTVATLARRLLADSAPSSQELWALVTAPDQPFEGARMSAVRRLIEGPLDDPFVLQGLAAHWVFAGDSSAEGAQASQAAIPLGGFALDYAWDWVGAAWPPDVVLRAAEVLMEGGDLTRAREFADRIEGLATHYVEAIDLLERALTRNRNTLELRRPLATPLTEFVKLESVERRKVLVSMARLAARAGHRSRVQGFVARAAEGVWNSEIHQGLAEVHLLTDDTVAAIESMASVAADPATPTTLRDEYRSMGEEHLGSAGWRAQVERAEEAMIRATLEERINQRVRDSVFVYGANGAVTLKELIYGPTLLAFVIQGRPELAAQLDTLDAQLRRIGGRVLRVEVGSRSIGEPNDVGVVGDAYRDIRSEASRAVGFRGAPSYYVVDPSVAIRFRTMRPSDALRQITALNRENLAARPPASPPLSP